jgi:hypothetical protein
LQKRECEQQKER